LFATPSTYDQLPSTCHLVAANDLRNHIFHGDLLRTERNLMDLLAKF